MGLTDPGGLSAAGLGRPAGRFAEETRMCTCSPVYVAPVLSTHEEGCALWSVLSRGSWG